MKKAAAGLRSATALLRYRDRPNGHNDSALETVNLKLSRRPSGLRIGKVASHCDLNQKPAAVKTRLLSPPKSPISGVPVMSRANAGLRTRLEQLNSYQLQLKFDRAELENHFLQMRLVEGRLQLERMKRCCSRQIQLFGCINAGTCELVHSLPSTQVAGEWLE